MPTYDFTCRIEFGGCGHEFDIFCGMDEISDARPECPECHLEDPVFREWSACQVAPIPKTLGMLADRNASKMSSDEKKFLKEKYKTKKEGPKLEPRRK